MLFFPVSTQAQTDFTLQLLWDLSWYKLKWKLGLHVCKYIHMYIFIYTDIELQNYSFRDPTLKYYILAKFNDKQSISHYLWSGGRKN